MANNALEPQCFAVRSGGQYSGQVCMRSRTHPAETARRLQRFFVERYDRHDLEVMAIQPPVLPETAAIH
jgi:hypothetical protein